MTPTWGRIRRRLLAIWGAPVDDWYGYAVVARRGCILWVVEQEVRWGDVIIRRGLTQGQAYGLAQDLKSLLNRTGCEGYAHGGLLTGR